MGKIVVFLMVSLMFVAKSAWACSCAEITAEKALAQADVVFVGEVVPDWGSVGVVTFQVSGYWKGKADKKIVLTPLSSGRSFDTCEFLFKEGEEYLVFAHLDKRGDLKTDICSGTEEKSRATEQIKKLGKPKTPTK